MTGETVKLAPLAVVAVMVIAVTVAGFEWPVPTHGANIFHLRLEKQARSTGIPLQMDVNVEHSVFPRWVKALSQIVHSA